jgi:Methyltransferase domain
MKQGTFELLTRGAKLLAKWVLFKKTVFLNAEFTRQVVKRYCLGKGLEIGPGSVPYTDPRHTILLDKYDEKYGEGGPAIRVDVTGDAACLPFSPSSFDYVFSSHVLVHMPNALGALREWLRPLKPGGLLVLRLPHGDRTFDEGRPLTTLQHHISDDENEVGYDDETHWAEWESAAGRHPEWVWLPKARRPDGTLDFDYIVGHGLIHYHVWTASEIADLLRHLGLRLLLLTDTMPDDEKSFLVVARVPATAGGNA